MAYTMNMPKKDTAYLAMRVSPECKELLLAIAESLGLSQTGAAEIVVRDYARRHGIKRPQPAPDKPASAD